MAHDSFIRQLPTWVKKTVNKRILGRTTDLFSNKGRVILTSPSNKLMTGMLVDMGDSA